MHAAQMHALTLIRSIDPLPIPINDNEIIEGWCNDVIFSRADRGLTNQCAMQVNAYIYADYIRQRLSVSRVYAFVTAIQFFSAHFSDW